MIDIRGFPALYQGWFVTSSKKTYLTNDNDTPVYEMYFREWDNGHAVGRAHLLVECHRPTLAARTICDKLNAGEVKDILDFHGKEIN